MIIASKGKGSYILLTIRDSYLKDKGYQEKMDELESNKIWKLLKCVSFEKYDNLGNE